MLAEGTRRYLLACARQALADELGCGDAVAPVGEAPRDVALAAPARVFVSWHAGDRLLGCIGTLQEYETLLAAVQHYSVQAGCHDPRVPAMHPDTLPRARADISVLGEPRELDAIGIVAIEAAIVPFEHGVILRKGLRRAVFLPVVWDKLPDRREFLRALARKAGIDLDREGADVRAQVFDVESFGE
ncbi:MAG TPA: AmmeMemoRadiSam system protein A [Nannocystaceae bacterium]|nr:AmmeMemoRadiSam system protein A [Nannocystaceae bacterium]